MDELNKAMNDPEFTGKIIDVMEEEKGEHVEVSVNFSGVVEKI